MKSIFILIVMFMPQPMTYPDSVKVEARHGVPLRFETVDLCEQYINKHWKGLEEFGKSVYPKANHVKSMMCIDEEM